MNFLHEKYKTYEKGLEDYISDCRGMYHPYWDKEDEETATSKFQEYWNRKDLIIQEMNYCYG